MDSSCLKYLLTEAESADFDANGFVVVEQALPPRMVDDLTAVVDRLDAQFQSENGVGPSDRRHMNDFIGKDELFLELLDWPKTFPKVWGILGWNIQIYLSIMAISPPGATSGTADMPRYNWHQDSGRLNIEIESNPRPRISLKVAYFLTDTTELGTANFYVIPGSHLRNEVTIPESGDTLPDGAVAIQVPAGYAVLFDRRIWHSASSNDSDVTRKVLFYGYSYRWLRHLDHMTVAHYMDRSDLIRRQLLGANPDRSKHTAPTDEDVPLKVWLQAHLGQEAINP